MGTDATLLDLPSARSTFREVNGIELHAVQAGDPDDPLVVLLHGFPDFWYGWVRQIPPLVEAGYRVLVPDGRGYNLSEKPRGVGAYRLSTLSGDVAALIDSAGRGSAHVVGHDWGGGVAWDLALRRPETVDRLAILNSPHPRVFRRHLRSDLEQLRRSWYVFFFQLPRLPEWVLGRNDAEGVIDVLESSANPSAFTDGELDFYREAFSREGALRGSLNWYRAAARRPESPPRDPVEPPTLVLWGEDDEALVSEMAPESVERCRNGRLERFRGARHWVQREEPERVNGLLVEHLRGE